MVQNSKYVIRILGCNKIPYHVPCHEIKRALYDVSPDTKKNEKEFAVGQKVKIIQGAFETFGGFIDSVNKKKKRLKVLIAIFGREAPINLHYDQVTKIS